ANHTLKPINATTPKRALNTVVILALLLTLSALTVTSAQAECARDTTEGVLGGLAGAALGGLFGSQFGEGSGKTVATIGGALLGGFAGNQLATDLNCEDEDRIYQSTQSSLEHKRSGETITWNNPDSGNRGSVTPTNTFRNEYGQNCRQFQQKIYTNNTPEVASGVACRQPNGRWKISGS
ncbi:MAG: glycine zipper 2TM domain-containing protein, partial [Parvibaculaceae bacterium]|nr:glycine zipper 2TM domain-containing protein [Parvibaculaceae bacterium]